MTAQDRKMFRNGALAVAGPDRSGLRPDLAACFGCAPRTEPARWPARPSGISGSGISGSGILAELASGGGRD